MTEQESRERPIEVQRAELAARPTMAEIRVVYERMQADIRARLAERLGLQPWIRIPDSGGRAGCGEYALAVGGESGGSIDAWAYERNVPDAQWPELTAIVEQVAAGYGFRPLERVENPGNQAAATTDRYGATFDILNGPREFSLGIYAGCHPVE